jgi:hypothetical protein
MPQAHAQAHQQVPTSPLDGENEEILDAILLEPDPSKARRATTTPADDLRRPNRPAQAKEELGGQQDGPRPKRRKRKRPKSQPPSSGPPAYLRWVIAAAVYVLAGLSIAAYMRREGYLS